MIPSVRLQCTNTYNIHRNFKYDSIMTKQKKKQISILFNSVHWYNFSFKKVNSTLTTVITTKFITWVSLKGRNHSSIKKKETNIDKFHSHGQRVECIITMTTWLSPRHALRPCSRSSTDKPQCTASFARPGIWWPAVAPTSPCKHWPTRGTQAPTSENRLKCHLQYITDSLEKWVKAYLDLLYCLFYFTKVA